MKTKQFIFLYSSIIIAGVALTSGLINLSCKKEKNEETVIQTLTLNQNWSIISTYVLPSNPEIAAVFSPVVQDVKIIKSGLGKVYWPELGINEIGNMVVGEGYFLCMSNDRLLNVSGEAVVPEHTPMFLNKGWSNIGYLRTTSAPVTSMISSIANALIIIKDSEGKVYWPYFCLNNIGDLHPGEGYMIDIKYSRVLFYPPNNM